MKTITILEGEHAEIRQFNEYATKVCLRILDGGEIQEEFFRTAIDFIRRFADGTHHKKEEDILFDYMTKNLGPVADKLIRNGMLVEHQMARYHVYELENALNSYLEKKDELDKLQIVSHMMGYVNLLENHIEKENTVVYPFGEKNLEEGLKEQIDREMMELAEEEKKHEGEKLEMLSLLQKLSEE